MDIHTGGPNLLGAPGGYGTKSTKKYFGSVSITYRDCLVKIKDNGWR
jgi:hypothetical protein